MAYFCAIEQNPVFKPAVKLLTSVTRAMPALVTTSTPHEYLTGLIVSFRIPQACGMTQLNGEYYMITVLNTTQFTIDLNTTEFDDFVVPTTLPDFIDICAWVVPVGEETNYTNSTPMNVT